MAECQIVTLREGEGVGVCVRVCGSPRCFRSINAQLMYDTIKNKSIIIAVLTLRSFETLIQYRTKRLTDFMHGGSQGVVASGSDYISHQEDDGQRSIFDKVGGDQLEGHGGKDRQGDERVVAHKLFHLRVLLEDGLSSLYVRFLLEDPALVRVLHLEA